MPQDVDFRLLFPFRFSPDAHAVRELDHLTRRIQDTVNGAGDVHEDDAATLAYQLLYHWRGQPGLFAQEPELWRELEFMPR